MIQTNLIRNTHTDLICDAAYDFYGTRFATAGLDQRIKIWRLDEHNGEWSVEEEWKAHDAPISRLSWAHPQHGQFIASSSFDRTVRIWERTPPDPVASLGINGIGAGPSERWVERALLTEAKGSVRAVEWAPKGFGMKIATISTDNHIRLYECLESGPNTPTAPASLMWSVLEDIDVPSLPLASTSNATSDPATAGDTTPNPAAVEPTLAPPNAVGSTSPYMGSTSLSGAPGSSTPRPGVGNNREADGGWDLSWCKEGYWGEVCAVTCGTSGVVKVIQFTPGQRPRAVLFLDSSPESKAPTPPREQSGSYAHPRREQLPATYAVTTVSWAPSCGRSYHLIATGGRDGRVKIWKVKLPEKKDKDGQSESEGEAGGETVVSPWTASIVADFDDHKSAIGKVAWNVTGTILTSAGNDGRVRLWRSTFGSVWRPMGSLDVVQAEDAGERDAMEE